MFREIENIYKKESPYNKIIRTFIAVYFLSFIFLWTCGLFKKPYIAILFVLLMIYIMKIIIENTTRKKITLKSLERNNGRNELMIEIEKKEIKIMRKYLNKNNINNNTCITSIIDYYRNKVSPNHNNIRIIEIINIVITILIPFINNNGIDDKLLKNAIPYLVTLIIIVVLVFTTAKIISALKKDLKGEYYMYERLEEIFSIILIDNNKETNEKKKQNKRKIKNKI